MSTSAASISENIERDIAEGRLRAGEKLVPVRELAQQLGVSPTTVAAAYRSLREIGVVIGRARQGSIVAPQVEPPISQVVNVPDNAIDALRGSPDPRLLPQLDSAFEFALAAPQAGYGDSLVEPNLSNAAKRLFEADGLDATHLTVTSGSMDAIERIILASGLRRGARIGVEDPGHVPVHQLARAAGLELVPLAVDDKGVVPEALDDALAFGLDALVITPRCHNPTGAALTSERAEVLSTCLAPFADVLLIQDDHAGLISGVDFHGIRPPGERHATVRSLGKAFGPDLRLAVTISDQRTHDRVSLAISNGPGWVSHFLQRAAAHLLTEDASMQTIRIAAESYSHRRESLIVALRTVGIAATGASGLNVWVPVPDEQIAVESARAAGFAIRAADSYRINSGPAVRLTISYLEDPDIAHLARALAESQVSTVRSPSM